MPKLILLIAVALALLISIQQLKALPPEKRKKQLINIGIWAGIGIAILAVISGRLHWLGAVVASSVGLLKASLPWLIRLWPAIASHVFGKQSEKDQTLEDAYSILGLKNGATRQEVIDAHRRLMLKMHPDKGGNHEDASRLNHAKKILLEHLDTQ